MGLLDFFSKGPLSEKKIAKIAKLACNPFAQPDIRMREMHRLLEDGSDLAYRGLLKRFSSNASGAIADEDEKKFLEDAVVDVGEPIVVPLKDYIRMEKQLSYALRALKRILGTQEAVPYFLEVLHKHGTESYRSTDAKLQLVWQLAEDLYEEGVFSSLVPFLQDHSDDVRWAVMDLLERVVDEKDISWAGVEESQRLLGELITVEEASPRILQRACKILHEREWAIPQDADSLVPDLAESYFLDKKRFVRKRAQRA